MSADVLIESIANGRDARSSAGRRRRLRAHQRAVLLASFMKLTRAVFSPSIGPELRSVQSALRKAEFVEQAVELIERAKRDRHLALLAARGALLDAHLDTGGQHIGELLLDAQQIA